MMIPQKIAQERELYFEIGIAQINKFGEELCGDTIITDKSPKSTTLILSDGLGSGVKANILSTLTTRILSVMLAGNCAMKDVVETLITALPACQVCQLAYSTFSIVHIDEKQLMQIVNYDNPPLVYVRDGKLLAIDYDKHEMSGKVIDRKDFKVKNGDLIVMMSDGEVHAGICNSVNLDWDWDNVADFVRRLSIKPLTAQDIAGELINVASKLYADKPGDDTSVAVVKVRHKRFATVLIGAPVDDHRDSEIVNRLLSQKGRKIVCGGTTGNIVARELEIEIDVDMTTLADGIPPIGKMEGIELCTEGIITISNALKLMKEVTNYKNLELHHNGASMLVRELLNADDILFMVGQAINPAHQTANMPTEFGLKTQITSQFAKLLSKMGKHTEIEYY